ncbi:MAG: hypothetical protein ACQEWM_12480 [Actinomycetota bacterium]
MRTTRRRLLTASVIVVIASMLGACGQADPSTTAAPDLPVPTSSESATPAPTPTTAPSAETGTPGTASRPAAAIELVGFETQNGSMRIQVPTSWEVHDASEAVAHWEGQWRWDNEVTFSVGDGSTLWYWDGAPDNVGPAPLEQHVVEQIAMDQGLAATAWWDRYDDETYDATVAVVSGGPSYSNSFMLDTSPRLHFLTYGPAQEQRRFTSREAAEAYLESDAVALALDVMATLKVIATSEVLPEDAGVEHEGTTYFRYTTRNGTASFLVPEQWTVQDTSAVGTNRAGEEVWENAIMLLLPNRNPVLHYNDMEFTNFIEEWEWSLGEVRQTQTDGLQAVSWTLGDSVPNFAGNVGVSLTDRGGTVRPADRVCSDSLCRSFTSLPLDVRWFEEPLSSTEEFFGSVAEEQLLMVVASLETHHDDPTRMP